MIPTPNTLATALEAAYAYLEACLGKAQTLTQAATEGKQCFIECKQRILLATSDPKELGANEAMREAKLTEMANRLFEVARLDVLDDEQPSLAQMEREATNAWNMLEIARVRVEGLKCQLRCAELAHGKEST